MKIKSVLLFSIILVTSLFGITACKDNDQSRALPDPLEAGWQGTSVCEVLEENSKVRVLKCVFEPGVGHEKHIHPAHFAYAIAGSRFRITDTAGTRDVDFETGKYYYKDSDAWHEALNIGDSTAVFLIMEPKTEDD